MVRTLMKKLSNMTLDKIKGVREHIMEMRDIASKLSSLKVEISESFLVHFILNSLPSEYTPFKISYNTHKENWAINDLLTMCVQEELRLKNESIETVHFTTHSKGNVSGRNQGRRSYGDNGRSNAPTNESSSQALVAQDGLGGYDWSNDFEVEPVNYALMAISSSSSSSSSDSEVQKCSKQCLESFKTLQKNYDTEREKHNKAKLEIRGYEIALESLESRILGHEKNELAWGEKYEFQNYELKCREIKINNLNLELEKVVKERDELKDKIAKWEESTKNLDEILNSQMSARDKTGLGYGTQLNELSSNHETDSENSLSVFDVRSSDEESTPANDMSSKADEYHVVPPPITGNFLTPRADISFAGLDEYAIRNKIIESQTTELNTKTSETAGKTNDANTEKPKSASESVVSNPKINRDRVIIEDWNSDDEEEEYEVQTVRLETQTVKTRDDKSGQNSKKQGIGFRKVKACFVCKSTDHLIKDCNFHDKKSQEPKLKNVVNTGQREGKPTTVGTRAVVSKGKVENVFKKDKWGNPEILLQDHAVGDSGCSSHMTGNKAYLSDYEDLNGGFVAFGSDPKGGKIMGKGKIKTANLDFDDVYFVDELKFNLFSVSQMCDKKNSVLFTESECLILSPSFKLLDESQVVLRAPRKDGVYSLDLKNIVPSGGITCLYANATADESKLWHRRLGHVNFKNINKLVKGHLVRGLPSKVFVNDHTCVACKKGKQHKASCKAKLDRIIRKPLELLHMDLFGPVSIESINKKRYCLVVTDDFSRFSWVFFLATKDETSEILCNLIIGLEKQLNHNVKIIRCDNGTEFKNYVMNEFCAKKGIKREFSVARTPKQNVGSKQTLGNVVLKLVKKVKTLKTALKRKSKKVLISESEGEESEDQGRKFQDIDDDPLVSLVRESMKEKSTDFGVSKEKSTDKGKRCRRRARSIAKKLHTGLEFEEEINTGREEINTCIEEVSTGSTKVDSGTASERGQREGKASMVEEDIQATHKTKEQMKQKEAGLEEAIKAKLEANAELSKYVLGQDLPEQDFANAKATMDDGT
ncbi:putative ribonuclease H-like domain-containing protein [Tanacetum coccineum]